jgi:cation-transporting ATPase E
MVGDGVNDMLALKKADLGIAMSTATAATRSISNLVLLDSRFDRLPSVVAEGRKVIANIERVSNLFLTKTAWSMTLALVFGLAMMSFPFLPRQLSAIDGFTIGIPAFFLALLPNARRYESGFLARALRFCVPSGVAIGLAVTALNLMHSDAQLLQKQTATAVLLSIAGVWVLTLLSLPFNKWRALILGAMVVWAAIIFTLPIAVEFFAFTPLTDTLWRDVAWLGLSVCLAITAVWRWSVAKSASASSDSMAL